ncbi:L,D-transpeptidase family protein [Mangrovibrevibacter kandeliae]|uniref:L,D-transpeptidase family protein n=1 Tax=Mangrovibrevibacter kandeliae TaxID=2968473 RepID=UPI0021184CAC|nr:murein L,D-transpeptidase family protein [Aurantimonas sp. CSK15Z-1]MCQ8783881.1 murein L,D-transpeptidase [Aurantimonas sp. CSK15Z-1]
MIAKRLLTAAALAAGLMLLSACQETIDDIAAGADAPLPAKLVQDIKAKGMGVNAPILVRLYKEESELEVWKQKTDGTYGLLKTYSICAWSGRLGPKEKEGDRQAPEGFYTITPGLMNPNSQYHLAINTGYPNAYDRANGGTGANLMVHGSCNSSGCYAMDDVQMGEIFGLARYAFKGGQRAFQFQAFPFRMTPKNMARHRKSDHYAFWKMLKQGSDRFELTHKPVETGVCERRYVFDPQLEDGQRLSPLGPCPTAEEPVEVAAKRIADEAEEERLVAAMEPTEFVTQASYTYKTGTPISAEAYAAEQHRREGYDRLGKRISGTRRPTTFESLLK